MGASFNFKKLDRSKIYGRRSRVMLDDEGEPCNRASLTIDGSLLVQAGMTAQGYFDEAGTWIENKELVGLDPEGKVLDPVPSTLGVAQEMEGPIQASELLDACITATYILEPTEISDDLRASLEAGDVYKAPFNYRPDYRSEVCFIVQNDEGLFCLVGNTVEPEWVEFEIPVGDDGDEEDDFDDDFDFDMF